MASDYPGGLDDFTTIVAAAGDTVRLRVYSSFTSGSTTCSNARLAVVRIGQ